MSKIKIAELQKTESEFDILSDRETNTILGGRRGRGRNGRGRRNKITDIDIANIVQINNNITIQLNFGDGDNINVTEQTNGAEVFF